MAYEIIIKKRFQNKLIKVLIYLENNWGNKVAEEFLDKIDARIDSLSKHPFIGAPSDKIQDVRGVHITHHNRLFYKVTRNKIIILNLYDTRTKGIE